ncbi:MAG: Fic/DOC family N-terminal domain-containing protein [Opitutales bacterium]
MSWDPKKPYNHLPPLSPEAELETVSILKACIAARSSLAELKQVGELIPNQALLINLLSLLEANSWGSMRAISHATVCVPASMRIGNQRRAGGAA